MRFVPALQEKSNFWDLHGRQTAPDHRDQHSQIQPDRAVQRFQPLGHTASCVLAEPSNNNKKSGRGQRFPPHPGDYFQFYSIECSFQTPFS